VEVFLEAGHEVLGIDNLRTGRLQNLDSASRCPRFQFCQLDLLDRAQFNYRVRQFSPQALVHLAALVSVPQSISMPELNFRLNIESTFVVAEAARRYGVQRLVFASSAAVYGNSEKLPLTESTLAVPISPYGAAKLASENILLGHAYGYGIGVRIQRYFNVYGPRQDPTSAYSGVISVFARQSKEQTPATIFGDGKQTRDFVYVRDAARANLLAATLTELPTGAANICTGKGTSLLDLADIFSRHYPGIPEPILEEPRAGDIRHSVGSWRAADRTLGFRAQWGIEAGLTELIRAGDARFSAKPSTRAPSDRADCLQ